MVPEIGDTSQTMVEKANEYLRYVVAVHVESITVGHVPQFILPVTASE